MQEQNLDQCIDLLTAQYIGVKLVSVIVKLLKHKGQPQEQFCVVGLCVYGDGSSPEERGISNPCVESSTLSRRPNFSAPLTASTASRAYLGLAPKAGLVPTVILMPLPEESKTQNDLPQLQNRMPEVR